MFEKIDDPHLRAYVVWVPELYAQESDVPRGLATVPDARATHFWDGDGLLMRGYGPVLGLPRIGSRTINAWDIFMIYGPDTKWEQSAPPMPDFWMHQLLSPGIRAPRLDGAKFAAQAVQLLELAARVRSSDEIGQATESETAKPMP